MIRFFSLKDHMASVQRRDWNKTTESDWEAIAIVWVKDDGGLVQGGGSLLKN